jgi:hypothetical protein
MSKTDKADAARLLGMKESEVIRVTETEDGLLVDLWNRTRSIILTDGTIATVGRVVPGVPSYVMPDERPPEPDGEDDPGDEESEVDEKQPAAGARKRPATRGR